MPKQTRAYKLAVVAERQLTALTSRADSLMTRIVAAQDDIDTKEYFNDYNALRDALRTLDRAATRKLLVKAAKAARTDVKIVDPKTLSRLESALQKSFFDLTAYLEDVIAVADDAASMAAEAQAES